MGDKEYRADPFAAQAEHGFVKLVEGAWNRTFIDELCAFPNAADGGRRSRTSALPPNKCRLERHTGIELQLKHCLSDRPCA